MSPYWANAPRKFEAISWRNKETALVNDIHFCPLDEPTPPPPPPSFPRLSFKYDVHYDGVPSGPFTSIKMSRGDEREWKNMSLGRRRFYDEGQYFPKDKGGRGFVSARLNGRPMEMRRHNMTGKGGGGRALGRGEK